ncbi:MAG: radical SAM protein [Deltaproteobacteria bacterium]|nr:radical SAM protein [Deltaproteobacteria bacterium]
MNRGIMRPETFRSILTELVENLDSIKVAVLYHGGEPLLHPQFPDLVKQIKALGITFVKTVTNGMLLTDSLIKQLVASGLDSIEFSLDGRSAAENDFIRHGCDYNLVINNIKKLLDFKKETAHCSPEIYLATAQFLSSLDNGMQNDQPRIPPHLIKEFSEKYYGEIHFKPCWAILWPSMEVNQSTYKIIRTFDNIPTNNCDMVESTITIRWNGDVVGCCYDLTSQYVIGNIHSEKLANIWNNQRYLRLRQSIATRQLLPLCSNCNVLNPPVYLSLRPEALSASG